MLDVVFIMLIFFIVTATFVKEIGLDVNSPDKNQNIKDADKKSIVVRITNRDRIMIRGRDIDFRAVRANIERLHAENPDAPVVVQPHPDSTTEVMIHVMDSARQAGVYNVSIAATWAQVPGVLLRIDTLRSILLNISWPSRLKT